MGKKLGSLSLFILLFICVFGFPETIKSKEIALFKGEIKGFKIEVNLIRHGFGSNCEAKLTAINKNSKEKDFYIEVQAIGKENSILSVVHFLLLNTYKGEKVEKISIFRDIKSCSHIKKIEVIAG